MTTPTAPAAGIDPRTTALLRVLTVAAFVVILNETIMANAIPSIMASMDVTARSAQWLSTAFMLTMAVVIPTSGWFLQRVSTRDAFAAAMTVFSAGTLLAGTAPTFGVLLGGRVVQAVGTAVMMPLLMTTLMRLVPPERRGRVMGNVTLTISVAPALGPTVSGVILQVAGWRWIFWAVLPLAVGMLLLGLRLLRREEPQGAGALDAVSVVLTAVGFGGLVHGLSGLGGETDGLASPWTTLGVGAVGLVLFVARQLQLQRSDRPLLDLRVLLVPSYLLGTLMMSLSFMGLMGAVILLPLFLQGSLGLTTLQTGLLLMPGGVAMGLLGPWVGRLYDRVGARPLVVPGAFVVLAGFTGMAWAAPVAPWWAFLALHVLVSLALGFMFTPLFTTSLGSLPGRLYSHGSALLGTSQQVAAAAGTALLVTVMATRASAAGGGVGDPAALASGVSWALWVAAGLAALVVALSLMVPGRTPATQEQDGQVPAPAPPGAEAVPEAR